MNEIDVHLPYPVAENRGTQDKPASWTMGKKPHAEIQPKNVPQGCKLEPVFLISSHSEFWFLLLQSLLKDTESLKSCLKTKAVDFSHVNILACLFAQSH